MNYIELINAFWEKRLVYPLTSCEADFYMYLLKECNSRKWLNPFKLPTQIIERDLNLNRRTICEIRNKLQLNGYIRFTASTRRGEITEYEIIDISEEPFANANRTQTERKPNANRTQSVTQTEHYYKTEKEIEKEKSSKEDKKKVASSLFEDVSCKSYGGYNLDFVLDDFYPIFVKWLDYKKSRRETYKTERSLKTCYNQLLKFSDGDVTIADYVVDKSIGNNWQGIFAPNKNDYDFINRKKNGTKGTNDTRSAASAPSPSDDEYFGPEDDTL